MLAASNETTVFILTEQVISVKLGHNVGGYNSFHELATYADQGDGAIIFSFGFSSFFYIYGCEYALVHPVGG